MLRLLRRLRARVKYRHFERDLVEEIEFHRAMKEAELRAGGLVPSDARPAAARALGNVTLVREDSRSVWIARWLEHGWQDARYAAWSVSLDLPRLRSASSARARGCSRRSSSSRTHRCCSRGACRSPIGSG
jgi:hypothetical protein